MAATPHPRFASAANHRSHGALRSRDDVGGAREQAPRRAPAPLSATLASIGCALLLLAATAGDSRAQIPGLLPSLTGNQAAQKAAAAKPSEAQETPEQAIARIRQELKGLADEPPPAPPGVAAAEIETTREARSSLRYTYERQLIAFDELARARDARKAADDRENAWTAFEEKPPYPIRMADELRQRADALRARIPPLESGERHLASEQARLQEAAKREDAALRAAIDAYSQAKTPADKNLAAWRRDAAAVSARRAAAWAILNDLLRQIQAETLQARRAELRLIERQIAATAGNVSFTQKDVDAARAQSAQALAAIERKRAAIGPATEARQRERDAAAGELGRLEADASADPKALALARARLRAADAALDASRNDEEVLNAERTLADGVAKLWEYRLRAATAPDADSRLEAVGLLENARASARRWIDFLQGQMGDARTAHREAQTRFNQAAAAGEPTAKYERQAMDAAAQTVASNERLLGELLSAASDLARWLTVIQAQSKEEGWTVQVSDLAAQAWAFVRAVWNFELFSFEETVVLDGRQVKTSQGVTVGKSVGAVMVFVVGMLFVSHLIRRGGRLLLKRGADERLVATLRRWILALAALLLLLFTLNIAKIPLTVFAFLGGTLAIAIGFGTQTIFKNLISGMILLVERSVQIGDIVEVEGVSGVVTAVDLRSSTVQAFDGTEAIVPNSVLLENKFTNWTRSDRRVRRILRVGVAYGSPARQVADILEECAKRHGLILEDPPPFVVFEDFGDNALVFALYYWFEFKPGASALAVMSDLRFMIEKRMREEGIVIAFPQRDVHLDSAGPLRIELVRGERSTPPAS